MGRHKLRRLPYFLRDLADKLRRMFGACPVGQRMDAARQAALPDKHGAPAPGLEQVPAIDRQDAPCQSSSTSARLSGMLILRV